MLNDNTFSPPVKRSQNTLPALLLCGAVMMLDGYDLSAMPLAVPHVSRAMGITPQQFAPALSAVLLGLGIGALFIAPLGDGLGRRTMIVWGTLGIALATLGTATAGGVAAFVAWRLGTGLALGACLPNISALSAELPPADRRAGTMTLVSLGIMFGAILAGLAAPWLVAVGGWPALFLLPGFAALALVPVLQLTIPAGSTDAPGEAPSARGARWKALFRAPLRDSMLIFIALFGVNAFSIYMISSWLPTILPRAGFSLDSASRYLSIFQFGGLVAGLLLSRLLDRGLAKIALGGAYVLLVLALVAFSVVPASSIAWGLLLAVVGGGTGGTNMAIIALAGGLFPPRLLATALGVGVAVARIGAVGGPFAGGAIIASGADASHFFLFAAAPALVCLLTTLLIPRNTAISATGSGKAGPIG